MKAVFSNGIPEEFPYLEIGMYFHKRAAKFIVSGSAAFHFRINRFPEFRIRISRYWKHSYFKLDVFVHLRYTSPFKKNPSKLKNIVIYYDHQRKANKKNSLGKILSRVKNSFRRKRKQLRFCWKHTLNAFRQGAKKNGRPEILIYTAFAVSFRNQCGINASGLHSLPFTSQMYRKQ